MGLFNKIKNVLFEEEEIEIPVFTKETEKKPDIVKPIKKVEEKKEEPIKEKRNEVIKQNLETQDNERETFKTEPTFQFPVFDEKEFAEPSKSRSIKNSEVIDRPKKNSKKIDFGRFETKAKEKEVKKKFIPSPIISPVYGVLDKNYIKEDKVPKKEEKNKVIDVDSIRKKAYGTLEEEIENSFNKPIEEFYEEEPTKTINELLIDSVDEEIETNDVVLKEDKKEDLNILETEDIKESKVNLDDTLESDLFNLIDSMYTNREDEK